MYLSSTILFYVHKGSKIKVLFQIFMSLPFTYLHNPFSFELQVCFVIIFGLFYSVFSWCWTATSHIKPQRNKKTNKAHLGSRKGLKLKNTNVVRV